MKRSGMRGWSCHTAPGCRCASSGLGLLIVRHHLIDLLSGVLLLVADLVALRHGAEQVLVLQRVGWGGQEEDGEEEIDLQSI